MKNWYEIENINEVDSPALVVFPDRVKENIRVLKEFVPDVNRLRPHVKTNKCAEVCAMMMAEGIKKFKFATIAEGEMLASIGAPDILMAYQPIGPRQLRFINLVKKFPATKFSCLVDNEQIATQLSELAEKENLVLNVFLDLNVGMNRTGVLPENALALYKFCESLKNISVIGLHAYDGHNREADLAVRTAGCDEGYKRVEKLHQSIEKESGKNLTIVTSGNTTISIHAKRKNVECSPGTFIFWDYGYHKQFAEQPFVFAALLVTRIISKPDDETICVDLGHKAVASENPLDNRVHFLNAPELVAAGHSEEHLILKAKKNNSYKVGDVLYGVPFHICPTVALHETLAVIENHLVTKNWNVVARKRKISI
ncbi:MAG: D-TA family PLP-dependent enzyme [Cyclobacteriaceae bacterium]|jgi:D-threonine aldolase|nr:D-TA family PLP-dependent enzyme [Cyclobacteriaceae bacterium]